MVPDSAIELPGYSHFRVDRSKELTGKEKGGGVCVYVKDTWCTDAKSIGSLCCPDVEFVMIQLRPFWLPREFSAVIFIGVYIHPRASIDTALNELHKAISEKETAQPECVFVVAGDFNKAYLEKVLPKFHQHITCNTRGDGILDHCYTTFPDAYKPLLRPPFGKSDHSAIQLLPAYKQRLKREPICKKEVRIWSELSDCLLQDCFEDVDWEMFRNAAENNVNEYADTVTCFIRTCFEDIVPKKTVRIFPNEKPWINSDVRAALQARNNAFRSGNLGDTRAALQRTIRRAKKDYTTKLEAQFESGDVRTTWQGLRTITDYRGRARTVETPSASLPGELNTFYARFESGGTTQPLPAPPVDTSPLTILEADVRRAFQRVNTRKAAGPDGIPGRVLKACASQLAGVFTDIFNLSLSQAVVPSGFKSSIVVPIPKHSKVTCLNDWRPVALTPIVSKCFERLVRDYICSVLPPTLDPWQFAYRQNRSTDDAVALAIHSALSHLDKRGKNRCVRMLFVDYSSAFNTIIPARLDTKLRDLGLHSSLCSWVLDFLSGRRQVVRMGNITSDPLTLNTGAPQGCVLSPLLYSLYTYDCTATHSSNVLIKYADDTTVMGLIDDDDETAYRAEVEKLTQWCQENSLALNVSKTKELIVDFRRPEREHAPITINGAVVEQVSEFKFLGINISRDLKWATHTTTVVKKAQQRLYCLRRLKKFRVSPRILSAFYKSTIESVLTSGTTAWFGNCTVAERKSLQRVVKTAQRIVGGELLPLQEIHERRCVAKAENIIRDIHHPSHSLFEPLLRPRPGKRFRSIKCSTTRLLNSFYVSTVRLLNRN